MTFYFALRRMLLLRYRIIFLSVIIALLVFIKIFLTSKSSNKSNALRSDLKHDSIFSLNNEVTNEKIQVEDIKSARTLSTEITPHCVIILKAVNGRLGNLLFMFASAYGLARTHGCFLYIGETILKDLRGIFEFTLTNSISKEYINFWSGRNITSQHIDCQFDVKLMRAEAVEFFEIKGYWQSHGYFSNYLDEIRNIFSFKESILKKIFPFVNFLSGRQLNLYKNMNFMKLKKHIGQTSPVKWIGIHVRRGDNLFALQHTRGYTISTVDFFDKAISYFTRRYKDRTLFIVASDDKPYCQKIFQNRSNVIITPSDFSPADDLATLSLCTDGIATCGSYSWWGAVLTGGIVVHDEKFPRPNTTLEVICPRSSYYPPWFLFL